MKIELSIDQNGKVSVSSDIDRRNEPVTLTPEEEIAVSIVKKALSDNGVDLETVHLERRTDNYLSVVIDGVNDFCRIKMGPMSKWFSLAISNEDRTDPRISPTKDVNKRHYKFQVSSPQEMGNYMDLIYRASRRTIGQCGSLDDTELIYCSILKKILENGGVDTSYYAVARSEGLLHVCCYYRVFSIKLGDRVKWIKSYKGNGFEKMSLSVPEDLFDLSDAICSVYKMCLDGVRQNLKYIGEESVKAHLLQSIRL